MLIKERMSHPVITIHPNMLMQEALNLMHREHIRRLPVVDHQGRLVGIVSERDLLLASPSSVTSLSVWELNYLLSKITVKDIMTRDVITLDGDASLEEAALKMADYKIGGLPVVEDGYVIGIITETDLFKVFLELFGAHEPGIRLEALVPNEPGELARLTTTISNLEGNIVALGTFLGESSENRVVCLKVANIDEEALVEAIEPFVQRIINVRQPQLL